VARACAQAGLHRRGDNGTGRACAEKTIRDFTDAYSTRGDDAPARGDEVPGGSDNEGELGAGLNMAFFISIDYHNIFFI
jgi:hypothetical protein